jgi:hypothetical protein
MNTEMTSEKTRIAHRKEALDLLESQQWEAVLLDLLKYAVTLIKTKTWLSVWNGPLPAGKEANDIVMEAVYSVIDGTRRADEGVPLIAFLKQVISGRISKLAESWENRKMNRVAVPGAPASGDVDVASMAHSGSVGASAEQREAEHMNSELVDLLINELGDDPELQDVIGLNMEGVSKRDEIADRMGKSVSDVTNMRKRLERRIEKFRVSHAAKIATTKTANERA